jgi:two-component system, cell cycle sensor histidine kinase and response regulator CckA
MKWSIRQKLTAVFALALVVIFANVVVAYSSTIKLIENQHWVTSSQEIITQVERTFLTFKDAEIAQRSYLIVANADDLDAYAAAWQQTNTNIQILKQLAADNAEKQQWVSLLEQKITVRLNFLQEELSLRENQGFESARQFILSRQDKLVMNDIQQLIQEMEQGEQNLLQKRIKQSRTSFQKTIVTFSLAAFVDLMLVALLYYLLGRYITRLKQTEQRLLQSENRLRAIIDAEPECIKLIAQDGTLLEINASGLAMMEVESADEVIGMPVISGVVPEYRDAFMAMHESVCLGNKGTLEFEIISFKGTRRWMETHAVPLPNESDNRFLHLAVTRDITKRKQAEQKIREQATLLDVATNGILVRDIHNQILFWNKGAENLYGWKVEEAVGQNVSQLLYKNNSALLEDALATVVNKGEWQGELHQFTKEGKEIIVESRWTLVRDEKGEPKSILTVNTEITQKYWYTS